MPLQISARPRLNSPIMLVAWPGIGDIATMAIEFIKNAVNAKKLAVLEPYEYFQPDSLKIVDGIIQKITFPLNDFYYAKHEEHDLIFFLSSRQPPFSNEFPLVENLGYALANEIVEVAINYKCTGIVTSGAAVSLIHHALPSKVWGIVNLPYLKPILNSIDGVNLFPASQALQNMNHMFITGLNGLILGAAREHGLGAISFLGEIPIYLQAMSTPYPRAAKAVAAAIGNYLHLDLDFSELEPLIELTDWNINALMQQFSSSLSPKIRKDVMGEIESLKNVDSEVTDSMTRADVKKAIDEIELFFRKGTDNDNIEK